MHSTDRNGGIVSIGSKVKVLGLERADFSHLTDDEFEHIRELFVGRVLDVYELDQYGQAWVEIEEEEHEGSFTSQGIGLSANEMELQT